jgi:hypothetical protein
MSWAVHVARMERENNAHRILVGKLERQRRLGRPSCRWMHNIELGLTEIGWDGMDWISFIASISTCIFRPRPHDTTSLVMLLKKNPTKSKKKEK